MSWTLLHLFLLMVGTLGQGNAQDNSKSAGLNCSAADHHVKERDVETIDFKPEGTSNSKYTTLYVVPEEGFQGISVVAQRQDQEEEEEEEEAWFRLGEECMPANNSWWNIYVQVILMAGEKLTFKVKGAEFTFECYRNTSFKSLDNIQVKARGHSHWKTTLDSSCTAVDYTRVSNKTKQVCPTPPSITTTEPSTTTFKKLSLTDPTEPSTNTTSESPYNAFKIFWEENKWWVIPAAAVAGVVILVVIVVACCYWRKRRCPRESEPQAMELQNQTHEKRNSLYEPCTEFQGIANAQVGSKRGSQNSLYEPFSKYQNAAGSNEQGGSKRGSQNSLYEPFSKYQNAAGNSEQGGSKRGSQKSLRAVQ